MRLLFFVLLILSAPQVFAYPELVKHGYPNCMACHVSPSGGGALTEYGRALSKELLSTWGTEKETRFLYFIPTTEKIAFGGDLRYVNVKTTTPQGTFERGIFMQRDIEVALTLGKWTFDVAAGTYDPQLQNENQFISRRHYAIYQAEDELTIRAGRFYPSFGIYIPEHNTYIRRGLGWDHNRESYNLEGAWQNEKWNFFATGIFGRPDDKTLKREAGGALSAAYNPTDKIKVGGSYYYGETDEITHHYVGPYAIVGLSHSLYLLSQITATREFQYTAADPVWGLVTYNRFDYEFYKGMHVFLMQEFRQSNFDAGNTRGDVLGVGLQFFPRPHWEFQAVVQKVYSQGFSNTPADNLYLLAHFYL